MKNKLLLMGLCLSVMACSDDNNSAIENPQSGNKVVLLKVDATTFAFEGGKELSFEDASTFTISHEYNLPGDFGSIKLKYDELNATIFDGDIHWMGLGGMNYPEAIDPVSSFESITTAVPMPEESLRELVLYDEFVPVDEWPYAANYEQLWGAVDNLAIVKSFRESNPSAKVHFFLYTPSVGDGNPDDWDWFVILKN